MGVAEAGRKWNSLRDDDSLPYRFRGHFPGGQLKCTPSFNRHDNFLGSYQVGGTISMSTKGFVGRIIPEDCGSDPLGLGRFSWHRIREKGGLTLRVLTFYRPCTPGQGTGSAYGQQLRFFDNIDRYACPRQAMLDDMRELIDEWKKTGEQVICMGDANEHVEGRTMRNFSETWV